MKKILFCCICFVACIGVLFACDSRTVRDFSAGYSQGYNSGSQGERLVGHAGSESACNSLAASAGCSSHYRWYSDTGNCFCK